MSLVYNSDFVTKAKAFGASLLYAPSATTDPLKNQGGVVTPNGTFGGNAKLVTPGLLTGSAVGQFDGVGDYIDTEWAPALPATMTFVWFSQRGSLVTEDAVFTSQPGEDMFLSFTIEGSIHFTGNAWATTSDWPISDIGTNPMFGAMVWKVGVSARLYTAVLGGDLKDRGTLANAGKPASAKEIFISHPGWASFLGSIGPAAIFSKELGAAELTELMVRTNPPSVSVVKEPYRISMRVTSPSGTPNRWAADEKIDNILSDAELTEEMPGGCKDGGGVFSRDPQRGFEDLVEFSEVLAMLPGGEPIWQGYFDKAPEVSGDKASISAALVGDQKHLEGNKAIKLGIIDKDLSKWGEPSTARRQYLISVAIRLMASTSVGLSSADPESGYASVINDFTNVITAAADTEAGEADYYSGGVDIGEVRYDFLGDIAGGAAPNPNYSNNIALGTDDVFSTIKSGTNHEAAAASNQSVSAPSVGYKYARIADRFIAASEGTSLRRIFAWQPTVLGDHGLPLRGIWPNVGFFAEDILAYAIPLLASPLRINSEYLESEEFLINQAWYTDVSMADTVKDVTKYELLDWFVRFDQYFQLRKPGTYGRKWKAYVGSSDLNEVGIDSERSWESVVVQYTDVDGSTRSVGPPGSGANTESELLRITDPDHPAVRAQLTRRDILELKGISTPATAIQVGVRFLEEANLLNRSGSATLTHYVLDSANVLRPAAQVMAGDWISFVDAADTSYRKIVNKRYVDREKTVEIDLDAPSAGLDALLERLQAVLVDTGVA